MAKNTGKTDSFPTPTLQEVSLDELPKVSREGKASRTVEEFIGSGMQAAQVNDAAPNYHASLKRYIKNSGAPVKVTTRKNAEGAVSTYLSRVEDAPEEAIS